MAAASSFTTLFADRGILAKLHIQRCRQSRRLALTPTDLTKCHEVHRGSNMHQLINWGGEVYTNAPESFHASLEMNRWLTTALLAREAPKLKWSAGGPLAQFNILTRFLHIQYGLRPQNYQTASL